MSIRLNNVVKECNVGLHTIVGFLHQKGFVDIKEDLNQKITEEQYDELLKEFNPDMSLRKSVNLMLEQQKKLHAAKKQGKDYSNETFSEYFEHLKHLNKGKKGKGKLKKKKKKIGKGRGSTSPFNSNGYKYNWIRIISTPM